MRGWAAFGGGEQGRGGREPIPEFRVAQPGSLIAAWRASAKARRADRLNGNQQQYAAAAQSSTQQRPAR